jgi:hypothetical protein
VVIALILGAVAGVLTAVARGWTESEQTQAATSIATQTNLRLQKVLRTARQLGAYQVGSIDGSATGAAIMIWKGDVNDDGQVQFSELALIEHQPSGDPLNAKLVYWDVEFPTNWTATQKQNADSTLSKDSMYDATTFSTFKSMANVTSTTLANRVEGAVFKRIDSSTTVRPMLEYRLRFRLADGSAQDIYGTTAVRPPATLPASQQ